MPTYLYKCVICSMQQEVIHGINEDYQDECLCGGNMIKVFYPSAVSFKGSGFYSTDK